MENPLRLTILIPCNSPEGLSQTLHSFAAENLPSLELILVQIGKPFPLPSIPETLSCLQLTNPNANNIQALTAGIQKAHGRLIAIFKPGTQLLPGSLKEVETAFSKDPNLNVLIGRALCLDAHGNELGLAHPGKFRNHLSLLKIWRNDPPPLSAVFARTSALKNLSFPEMEFPERWHEYNILCRLTQNEQAVPHPDFLTASPLLPTDLLLMRAQEIDEGVKVSRLYWQANRPSIKWSLRLSFFFYRLSFRRRALSLLREANIKSKQGYQISASLHYIAASFLSPKIVFIASIFPFFRDHFLRRVFKLFS